MKISEYFFFVFMISATFVLGCSNSKHYELPYEKEDFVKVVREYGWRYHPIVSIRRRFHKGMSFELKENAPIYAMHDGAVLEVERSNKGFGKRIIIAHHDSVLVHYYYLNKIHVSDGELVEKGQTIGISGNTGTTVVNGLGVRILVRDSIINPAKFFPPFEDLIKKE